ncbi:MAG: adenosylhomocysteinase [Oscillospiraceae bacterium]|nr:adenosylhomocysteinase [Oscillospiraceae bacterium]
MSVVKDMSLAPSGVRKIEWVKSYMPVLSAIGDRFEKERPFAGKTIAMSIHLEAKTAYLALTLRRGGARVCATGCNPLSTQDDVAAALASLGVETFAVHGVNEEEYTEHLTKTLSCVPDIIIDDGGDFVSILHDRAPELAKKLLGGCEETTTGVARLSARDRAGKLNFPMFAVNNAKCKHLFDNRHGTGQSVWDAIMNTTNCFIAGKRVVVAGYGFCGRGVALRAKGLGANVIICEADPFRALEAYADGYLVMIMDEAASLGDIFVTTTGCRDIIVRRHFEKMKNGVLLANAGHFDCEINKVDLNALAEKVETRKPNIQGFYMPDGRILNLLGEGRLVNLAAGNGHPAEIMDLSFVVQALMMEHIASLPEKLSPALYEVPTEIDRLVAREKLRAEGIKIDTLTEEQENYLKSW